jgi:hypothetical protein
MVHFSIQFKFTLEFFNWCQLEFKLRMFNIQLGLLYRQVHENPFHFIILLNIIVQSLCYKNHYDNYLNSSLWSVIHFEHVIQLPHTKNSNISSCLSLGQIELNKYLQFSFTLASSNSVIGKPRRWPLYEERASGPA